MLSGGLIAVVVAVRSMRPITGPVASASSNTLPLAITTSPIELPGVVPATTLGVADIDDEGVGLREPDSGAGGLDFGVDVLDRIVCLIFKKRKKDAERVREETYGIS